FCKKYAIPVIAVNIVTTRVKKYTISKMLNPAIIKIDENHCDPLNGMTDKVKIIIKTCEAVLYLAILLVIIV
mgnify:CR=1